MSTEKIAGKTGRYPYILGIGIVLAVLAYLAYWFFMAGQIKNGVQDWISQQKASGVSITFDDMSVSGFPFRFVLNVEKLRVHEPFENMRLKSDDLKIVAQSYNLFHLLVFSEGDVDMTGPDGFSISLSPSKGAIASLKFNSDYTLKALGTEFKNADVQYGGERFASIDDVSIGLQPLASDHETLQAAFSSGTFTVGPMSENLAWLGEKGQSSVLWAEVENFYPVLSGKMTPVEWRVDQNKIQIQRGELNWGPLDIATRANFHLDRDLNPDGTVGVHLRQPDELKSALRSAGLLTAETEAAISGLALLSQDNNFATVKLKDRGIYLLGNKLGEY